MVSVCDRGARIDGQAMVWMNLKSYSFNVLSIFAHAPAESGVYQLHDSSRCFYVGYSENILQTLLQHMRGDNSAVTAFDPDGFSFELHPDASTAGERISLARSSNPHRKLARHRG